MGTECWGLCHDPGVSSPSTATHEDFPATSYTGVSLIGGGALGRRNALCL